MNEKSICLSKLEAGLVLGVSDSTIGGYIRSGKVLLGNFLLSPCHPLRYNQQLKETTIVGKMGWAVNSTVLSF